MRRPSERTAVLAAGPITLRTLLIRAVLVIAGSMLMALGAKLSIPIGPVPITGQTLALPIVVALLGTGQGTLAVALYLVEGASGLPVFASGSGGPAILFGPTAGYLWAYPVAAFMIGWMFDAGLARTYAGRVLAIFLGTSIVLAAGMSWLSYFVGGLPRAFALGVAPFIIGDGAKVLIAAGVPAMWRRIAAAIGL